MQRIAIGKQAALAGALMLFCGLAHPAHAAQDDALREEIVKISQVTGDDAYKAQLAALLKDKERGKKLVAGAVSMANGGDQNLSFFGAITLAQVAAELKDFKACETLYRVAMAKSVQLYSTTKIFQSYVGLIYTLYDAKKYADAVRVCTELLELKPVADGRVFKYLVEDRFGDFGFRRDADFDPVKPLRLTVHEIRILALAKDGKNEQALKQVENLVRAGEGWKERQLQARVLHEIGQVARAAKVYEDVLERIAKDADLAQEDKDDYLDRNRYRLSSVYVEAKQIEKAAELLKGLIDRHPDDAGYYNDLGYIWADHDMNLKEAEVMIRKALDLDRLERKKAPDFVAADDHDKGSYLDSLGWVLFKQKRYDDAKKYLLEALKDKEAQHLEIFDHLGDTYQALGHATQPWMPGSAASRWPGMTGWKKNARRMLRRRFKRRASKQ